MEVQKEAEKYGDYSRNAKASIIAGSHGSCRPSYGLGGFMGVKTLIELFLYKTHMGNEKTTKRYTAILALGKQSAD